MLIIAHPPVNADMARRYIAWSFPQRPGIFCCRGPWFLITIGKSSINLAESLQWLCAGNRGEDHS